MTHESRIVQTNTRIPVFERQFGTWHIAVLRSTLTVDELKRRYDSLAKGWTRTLRWLGYTRVYRHLAQTLQIANPAIFRDGARVLECGAGTGVLSLALAAASDAKLRHHLLDLSPRMLEAARTALQEAGISERAVTLQPANIQQMPYDDESFDCVIAAHVIEHLPDPVSALREMARVLKPGGAMLVIATRRSFLGSLIQLKWAVHRAARHELRDWLRRCGQSRMRSIPLEGPWWCSRMSIACLAIKR